MAAVSSSLILILGGYKSGHLADGVLVDRERKRVFRFLSAGELQFYCPNNRNCLTDYGAIIAIIEDRKNQIKLVEVSKTDYKVTAFLAR